MSNESTERKYTYDSASRIDWQVTIKDESGDGNFFPGREVVKLGYLGRIAKALERQNQITDNVAYMRDVWKGRYESEKKKAQKLRKELKELKKK